jgi:hypothetical protein
VNDVDWREIYSGAVYPGEQVLFVGAIRQAAARQCIGGVSDWPAGWESLPLAKLVRMAGDLEQKCCGHPEALRFQGLLDNHLRDPDLDLA